MSNTLTELNVALSLRCRKARKQHTCTGCGFPILSGQRYLALSVGSGLGAHKFPDHVHQGGDCLRTVLRRYIHQEVTDEQLAEIERALIKES
jgi:hypothetical protein